MLTIRKMGPIGNLLGMLPGAGQMKDALAAVDDSQLDRVQAIIRGMTPAGARRPEDHQRLAPAAHRQRLRRRGVGGQPARRPVLRGPQDDVPMAGQMGMPFGRKSATRKAAKGKNKKGKKGGRGPTPPKVRNPLGAGWPARRVPRPVEHAQGP